MALAFLWIVSGVFTTVSFPPTALAGALVRETPGDLATFFIELLGHWALRLAGLGAVLVAGAIGSEALVRTAGRQRSRPWGAGSVLAIVAGMAAVFDPTGEAEVLPMAATLFGAVVVYAWTVRGLESSETRVEDHGEIDLGRRRVLGLGLGAATAVAVGGGVAGWVIRRLGGPDTDVAIAPAATPASIPAREAFPEIAGLTPEVTSAADHYVVDVNLVQPSVEADTWTLSVGGRVREPLELTFAGLQDRFEMVEQYSVLSCISNEVGGPLVGHSAWRGPRLAEVLAAAGVEPGAVDVVFRAADGYTDSITIDTAMDPSVLLAVAQNGEPLTREHGFPCRVRVPALYGMKNVKWLESIEVVDRDYKGYWMKRGWSDVAIVKTQSRIDVAGDDLAAHEGQETWIAGIAWAGDRGISRVEVSVDGGEAWHEAQLREPIAGNLSWRQWAYRWTPERTGRVAVMCRATDADGEVQSEALAAPHPAGATGLHSVEVAVS